MSSSQRSRVEPKFPPQTTSLIVTVRVVGFHHWPMAPETVRFLRTRHRHTFKFTIHVNVDGDDREQEFFLLQRELRDAITFIPDLEMSSDGYEFGSHSCEQIAKLIAWRFAKRHQAEGIPFPSRIEVWEDDENGAAVHPHL